MSKLSLRSIQKRVPEVISIGVTAIGCLVLIGWMTDTLVLKSVLRGLPSMRPNTALSLIVASLSLWLLTRGHGVVSRTIGKLGALLLVVFGAVAVAEAVADFYLGVDEWIFRSGLQAAGMVGALPL